MESFNRSFSNTRCRLYLVLFGGLLLLASAPMCWANIPTTHQYLFVLQSTPVTRLCGTQNVITVNGQFPGPTLEVRNGDSLVITVVNNAQYNASIHWHGVRQNRTGWADGPVFVTQCPIAPGGTYTYRFTIEGQEGTLWWHAHSSWLRATVYGVIIIRPRFGQSYPFPAPTSDNYLLLGEWWNANPIDVINQATFTGGAPQLSDAYTINGQPGDLYNCSSAGTVVVPIIAGETSLLRIINGAMNQNLFFAVANHTLTVVGADAAYTKPFNTSYLMLGPGQTTDVLITANQPSGRYYIAARAYQSTPVVPINNSTTTAILKYLPFSCFSYPCPNPTLPSLPPFNDTPAVAAFTTMFRSFTRVPVPTVIDDSLFITVNLGLNACPPNFPPSRCQAPFNTRLIASMNNASFLLPTNDSILQAFVQGTPGVYTTDFPANPPLVFDYTSPLLSFSLLQPTIGTKTYKLRYGARVQVVLQGTSLLSPENHPIHLHGNDFYILAEGFGNYNPVSDPPNFNLVDPPLRNTVSLRVGGWAVIRFVANNPGAWIMHCHLDVHLGWGLGMVFLVDNGVGSLQSIEPPPADLPRC